MAGFFFGEINIIYLQTELTDSQKDSLKIHHCFEYYSLPLKPFSDYSLRRSL